MLSPGKNGTKTLQQYDEEKLVAAMSNRQSGAAQGASCDSQAAKGAAKDVQDCAKDAKGTVPVRVHPL